MAHRFATPLVSTVRRRLDELWEAFVVWPCYLEHALRPKLNAQAKIYFTDPLYARLEVGATRDTSALSEQQLGMALWRGNERDRPGSRWRTVERRVYR